MGSLRRHVTSGACAAVAAALVVPTAVAGVPAPVQRPPLTWLRGDGNYTKASRNPKIVRYVVVHATEGPFWGSVYWLRNKKSHASANYLVSRSGTIIQLVHLSDVAWHTGNPLYNRESVGIEHEGVVGDPAGFTKAEYRSSAQLAAWLALRFHIPIDREHFIGHSEVPDPAHPGLFGGRDHHTDPGRYWDWKLYLRLVRRYAFPPPPISVRSTTLDAGEVVEGRPVWSAETSGPVSRVQFSVDGHVLWTDHVAPFAFAGGRGWNTLGLPNGTHVLALRAFGPRGARSTSRLRVHVRNRRFELTTAGLRDGEAVHGVIRIHAATHGPRAHPLRVYVDGSLLAATAQSPSSIRWDTRRLVDGTHTLDLRSRSYDGRTVHKRFRLVVRNRGPRAAAASGP